MPKKIVFALLIVIAAFVAFYFYTTYRVAPAVNFNALNLVDLDGQPVKMSDYKGKKLVVSFGASWCPNCIDELNTLKKIQAEKLQGIDIVVISDEELERVADFKARKLYPFTFLKMDKAFAEIGIHSIPTTYIFNTKAEVTKEEVGYIDWEDESTLAHLKALME
jgi:thiol-disulfide isomerase/thioredoxin